MRRAIKEIEKAKNNRLKKQILINAIIELNRHSYNIQGINSLDVRDVLNTRTIKELTEVYKTAVKLKAIRIKYGISDY